MFISRQQQNQYIFFKGNMIKKSAARSRNETRYFVIAVYCSQPKAKFSRVFDH